MHNGYGSGDVEITMGIVFPLAAIPDDATAVTVAGHTGIYRRIDPGQGEWTVGVLQNRGDATDVLWEEWVVDIEGTTIAIHLRAKSGASEPDLADAHGIIESVRYETSSGRLGFRLVFMLTTDDWDSG